MVFTAERPLARASSPHGSPSNGCCIFRFHHGPVIVRISFPTPTIGMKWACAIQNVSDASVRHKLSQQFGAKKIRSRCCSRCPRYEVFSFFCTPCCRMFVGCYVSVWAILKKYLGIFLGAFGSLGYSTNIVKRRPFRCRTPRCHSSYQLPGTVLRPLV